VAGACALLFFPRFATPTFSLERRIAPRNAVNSNPSFLLSPVSQSLRKKSACVISIVMKKHFFCWKIVPLLINSRSLRWSKKVKSAKIYKVQFVHIHIPMYVDTVLHCFHIRK
jgi:hypothetical protein